MPFLANGCLRGHEVLGAVEDALPECFALRLDLCREFGALNRQDQDGPAGPMWVARTSLRKAITHTWADAALNDLLESTPSKTTDNDALRRPNHGGSAHPTTNDPAPIHAGDLGGLHCMVSLLGVHNRLRAFGRGRACSRSRLPLLHRRPLEGHSAQEQSEKDGGLAHCLSDTTPARRFRTIERCSLDFMATAAEDRLARFGKSLGIERKHVLTGLAIIAVTLAILRSFGRPLWCACGSLIPWSSDINGSHNSQHFIDPYSVSHFEHGLLFFAFLLLFPKLSLAWRTVAAATLECGWELLENSSFIIDRYRAATVSSDYYGDAVLNSLSDVIFATLGFVFSWLVVRNIKLGWPAWWVTIALCEFGLIFTVKDSLAINVIMLSHPIEAIRVWQSS